MSERTSLEIFFANVNPTMTNTTSQKDSSAASGELVGEVKKGATGIPYIDWKRDHTLLPVGFKLYGARAPQAATPLPEQDERALFEAWYDAFEFRKDYDKYGPSEAAFTVWQASAALTQQAALEAPTDDEGEFDELDHGETVLRVQETLGITRTGWVSPDVIIMRIGQLQRRAAAEAPIPMILHCPKCGVQHIDAPDERTEGWVNPPHRSHLCHCCGNIWRPADVPTEGVAAIQTRGKNDSAPEAPASEQAGAAVARLEVWEGDEFHLYLTGNVWLEPGSYDLFTAATTASAHKGEKA